MARIYTKSCPRCKGDLAEEKYGSDILVVCIQCGYEKEMEAWKTSLSELSKSMEP